MNRPVRGTKSKFPRVSAFATRLITTWRSLSLPTANASIVVAVSGGADSTALLLALDELINSRKLSVSLTVAHLDHSLRNASKDDALWVEQLATELGYECVRRRTDVKKRASTTGDNLEQAARRARYEFLAKVAREKQSHLVLTAHTLDDQAETILLRLLRGSAAEGLSGIETVRSLTQKSKIKLVRPLLPWARRTDAEEYCRSKKVDFRMDEMNQNEKFSRVKVRKQLLPMMQSFNNKIVEALARTATLLREDAGVLSSEAETLLIEASAPEVKKNSKTKTPALNVLVLSRAPAAVRRRALRQWILSGRGDLRRLEMVHLAAVDRLIQGDRGGRTVELPDGARVLRKRGWLGLEGGHSRKSG